MNKKLWILILSLLTAVFSAALGVLQSSCTSYLVTTKSAKDTSVKITTTTTVDSISLDMKAGK